MKLSQWDESIAIIFQNFVIDHLWHYLICYKLNLNLHRNNIQLHALIKYTMLITYLLESLKSSLKIKFIKKIASYITMGIYII
jgi:hypothetical protein